MSEDRGSDGTDPTLTPSQVLGAAPTRVTLSDVTYGAATGELPSRYALGAQLGAGGMGEVLLAKDHQIDREVAIKRMLVAPTPDATARFMREAKIQGRLEHPAIVPVHELATDTEGRPFFVMKRLAGTTLARLIEKRSDTPRQKLLRAFADVCLAVEFAHSRGIIHRDLKPANIMLGDYGEVYVLDWGVARILDERDEVGDTSAAAADGATEAGAILGTPGYIAPEMLRGEHIDARADVYALGCILFEILAGEPLLPRGRAALEAALAPVDARPSRRATAADVAPELDEACVAATALDLDQRPTARELATRIERYLDGDRDLALRKNVAAGHTAAARAALAAGDGAAERATAMREAGRAIAIDPHDRGAADILARLMLEPPREVPAEVEARVEKVELETGREKLRISTGALFSFFLFVPIVFFMGLRSGAALGVFVGGLVANIALSLWVARGGRAPKRSDVYVGALAFALLIALIALMFSPFLIAPAIAAVAVMMFSMDPRLRWVPLALGFMATVLVPWLLELAGVWPDTTRAVDGDLVLRSEIATNRMPQSEISFALFTIVLVGLSGFMASRLAQAHRRAVRTLELQAWHLRQLMS